MIPIGTYAHNPQTGQEIVLTEKGWVATGSPQMSSAMSPTDQQGVGGLNDDAQQAAWLAQKAGEFKSIQNGQGPGDVTGTGIQFHDVHIPLPILDHINLNPAASFGAAINPRIGDMESVTNQAWAHMRPTGSGPLRMPEVEGFQQSFPNIENSPQTNTDIAQRLNQDASLSASKLKFINDFIAGDHGNFADANAAWQARQSAPGTMMGSQGQPLTQGQQAYAQAVPGSGPAGGSQNPYYPTPQAPAPQGAYQVTQTGQYMAPPGQLNMRAGQQPQQAPVLTWNPQTGAFQ